MTRYLIALSLVACSASEPAASLLQSAIACHQKGLALVDQEGTCNDRLIRIETLVATDPDCQRIYRDAGSGLHCVDPAERGFE